MKDDDCWERTGVPACIGSAFRTGCTCKPRRKRTPAPLVEERTDEMEYMQQLRLALGRHPDLVLFRQNAGEVPVRDRTGKTLRIFYGAPNGAGDLSGWTRPDGIHIEVELKSAKGRQRKEQVIREHNLAAGGAIYVLCQYDAAISMGANVELAVLKIVGAIRERRK
jgi:hypothetical protein